MNRQELEILHYVEALVPDADGIDVMLTALDEEGIPCFVYNKPASSEDVFLYVVFRRQEKRKRVIIPVPAGLFEWMGFSRERRRSPMFYRDQSMPDDLVTGLMYS